MRELLNWFCRRNDKQKHLMVGAIMGFLYFPVVFVWDINAAIISNFIASSAVFIGKEIYDKYKPNATGFDKVDLFADYLGWGIGAWVGSLFLVLFHYINLCIWA